MLFDFQFYDLPYWTKKDYIKDPEAYMKKRDWLINLYFSKPDYEEPFKKVYYAAYAGTKFGFLLATLRVVSMNSKNPPLALRLFGKVFGYTMLYALTYSSVTATVANLRGKKDDYLNHLIGGASVGFINGVRMRSSGMGAITAVAGAIAAFTFKYHQVNDIRFFNYNIKNQREDNFLYGGRKYADLSLPVLPRHARQKEKRTEHYSL